MNWPEVFKGIQLCIGFQLSLIAIFLLRSGQKRNYLLGAYTVLISISSLSSGLYTYLEDAPILSFLFGAHLIIFHAPLLYLYIRSLGDERADTRLHFAFPLAYTAYYVILKLYFSDFFREHSLDLLITHLILSVAFTSTYFYHGSRHFRLELRDSLKQKALRKFRLFYIVTNIHSISLYSLMAISYVSYLYFSSELTYFNEFIVPQIFSIIVYIHPVTSIIFITYLLSETHSLQSLILDKGITKSVTLRNNRALISEGIDLYIEHERRHKDPEFGLKQLSKAIGVNDKELAEYFTEELSISFNDYLYQKKIQEFKSLVNADLENTYSLEGLAQLAGFNSKATFYRVFKKVEGVTPAQYKEQQAKLEFASS
ncbi:MAG: helix-turn-helix domain-containing protein [Bacteroidota bacterium]